MEGTQHIHAIYKRNYSRSTFLVLLLFFNLTFHSIILQQVSETKLPFIQNYTLMIMEPLTNTRLK